MDIDERIDSSGCGDTYRRLEDCMVDADRDWRKCQVEVIAFRECMVSQGRAAKASYTISSSSNVKESSKPAA
jgi:hypothetical protein